MIRSLIIVARLFYWTSGFAVLAAGVAMVLHFFPATYNDGERPRIIEPSWELVALLGALAVGTWLIAQVLAFIAARQLERLDL